MRADRGEEMRISARSYEYVGTFGAASHRIELLTGCQLAMQSKAGAQWRNARFSK